MVSLKIKHIISRRKLIDCWRRGRGKVYNIQWIQKSTSTMDGEREVDSCWGNPQPLLIIPIAMVAPIRESQPFQVFSQDIEINLLPSELSKGKKQKICFFFKLLYLRSNPNETQINQHWFCSLHKKREELIFAQIIMRQ